MNRCPITYEIISNQEKYSARGLRLLSPQLKDLHPLPFTAAEQRMEAVSRAGKMSIQGVQTKLSARLKVKDECFEIVDSKGQFILKTQSEDYPELPENEAVTMSLAAIINIEVPVHGLIYAKDNTMTYFIKRFDRTGVNKKIAVEDFAQLSGLDRQTKYNSSMEKVSNVISTFCTFPKIEYVKLFKLNLFNYLVGNEDMHLKNFSLISKGNKITLSPAYDLVNSTIVLSNAREESALPLNCKKNNLKSRDLIDYFGSDRLGLNQNIVNKVLDDIQQAIPAWRELIASSFMSEAMQIKYLSLLEDRCRCLGF